MNPDKPVQAHNVSTATERPRRQIPHEAIAHRAEQLWRSRGQPAGSDEAIWLDHGRLVLKGPVRRVLEAYEGSRAVTMA